MAPAAAASIAAERAGARTPLNGTPRTQRSRKGERMTRSALNRAIAAIQELDPEEPRQVQHAVQERLEQQAEADAREAFHQALLASGLVKALKTPSGRPAAERPLVPIQGKPLSETLLEDRR
jgi:hypothetical protein